MTGWLILASLALVALAATKLGKKTAGKVTVVPWMKHPKLTANTANTWVNLRAF